MEQLQLDHYGDLYVAIPKCLVEGVVVSETNKDRIGYILYTTPEEYICMWSDEDELFSLDKDTNYREYTIKLFRAI